MWIQQQQAHQLVGSGETPRHSTRKHKKSADIMCAISGDLVLNRGKIIRLCCHLTRYTNFDVVFNYILHFGADQKQTLTSYPVWLFARSVCTVACYDHVERKEVVCWKKSKVVSRVNKVVSGKANWCRENRKPFIFSSHHLFFPNTTSFLSTWPSMPPYIWMSM